MKFSNHLIILSTIILGFWIDDFLNPLTIKLYLELNFGFLIFAYWVFAILEKLNSSAALFYGLVADLFDGIDDLDGQAYTFKTTSADTLTIIATKNSDTSCTIKITQKIKKPDSSSSC